MRINKLQLNDFGKFSNKEINLLPNLNVIKGNNESGKSTVQKFIVSMLYGISKDKRKSNFTDFDKYLPWGKESFSGKISYTLDDGKTYEVYRDFTKKNPTVYNENAEDITNLFKKTTKGSNFFEEQTGIDENTMMSSMVTEQSSVVIDQASENFIIQKIANMAETGDERISYDNAQKFLTKKRNEEVGTDKTRNRPINNLQEEKIELLNEREKLEKYNEEQYEIEEKIKKVKEQKNKNDKLLNFTVKYKNVLDKEMELKNKVAIYQESVKNNEAKKEKLEKQQNEIKMKLQAVEEEYDSILKREEAKEAEKNETIQKLNDSKNKKSKTFMIVSVVLAILAVALILLGVIPAGVIALVGMIVCLVLRNQSNKKINSEIDMKANVDKSNILDEQKDKIEKIQNELKELELNIDVLNRNNNDTNKQVQELKNTIIENEKKHVEELLNEFSDISEEEYSEILRDEKILSKISILQNLKNNDELELQKHEYRKKYILPELERLAEVEERLYSIDEREQELKDEAEAISIASRVLSEAYEEMKENVVPKFTENLSLTISNVTSGKYSKVVTNDKEGMLIEKENGEYVPAKALSMGTIDQLYLSLRLAITNEATNQNMPIILDEAFAYYDSERLENILKYISNEFRTKQILLFTCTSREVDLLNELDIEYNLIEL